MQSWYADMMTIYQLECCRVSWIELKNKVKAQFMKYICIEWRGGPNLGPGLEFDTCDLVSNQPTMAVFLFFCCSLKASWDRRLFASDSSKDKQYRR